MRVAVAGGTGQVGRYVVTELREAGHEPVVLSRSTGIDVVSGTGLDRALDGVEALIDVTNTPTQSRKKSVAFFTAATTNLLAAGQNAGVRHHLALSIVGIDRVDIGYYAAKLRQEELVLAASRGTVLRATQFHEFADQVLERIGKFLLMPVMLSQPVAAREVAGALVGLAAGPPVGMAPELAGPERLTTPDMARMVLRARGSRRPVIPVRIPGAAGKAMATGGLLPTGPGPRGKQTFEEWVTMSRAGSE